MNNLESTRRVSAVVAIT